MFFGEFSYLMITCFAKVGYQAIELIAKLSINQVCDLFINEDQRLVTLKEMPLKLIIKETS